MNELKSKILVAEHQSAFDNWNLDKGWVFEGAPYLEDPTDPTSLWHQRVVRKDALPELGDEL